MLRRPPPLLLPPPPLAAATACRHTFGVAEAAGGTGNNRHNLCLTGMCPPVTPIALQGAGELLQCEPPRQGEEEIRAIINAARTRSAAAAAMMQHVRGGRRGRLAAPGLVWLHGGCMEAAFQVVLCWHATPR